MQSVGYRNLSTDLKRHKFLLGELKKNYFSDKKINLLI